MKSIKNIQKTGKSLLYYKSAYAAHAKASQSVQPIEKTKTSNSHNTHVGIDQTEDAYNKLRQVSEEYRSFFKNEQAFEDAYSKVGNSHDFIDHLVHFISLYNQSLTTLIEFDKYFNTTYHVSILELVRSEQNQLSTIGIRLEPDGIMRLSRFKMMEAFALHPNAFNFMIESEGLAIQLLQRFRNVKGYIMENHEEHLNTDGLHGLVIDQKC